jgi:hypothetical protein
MGNTRPAAPTMSHVCPVPGGGVRLSVNSLCRHEAPDGRMDFGREYQAAG